MLAYHVEWHLRDAMAPLLFHDTELAAARAERSSPVASTEPSDTAKAKKATIERFRQSVCNKSIDESLDEFLNSDERLDRTLAIYVMAALDKLTIIGKAFRETKHADVLDTAIIALRHWIGRGPGRRPLAGISRALHS